MVVYLTTHSLQKTSSWGTSYAPVFAAIFTNASGSEHWMQCGDLIAGTAAIKQYNGFLITEKKVDGYNCIKNFLEITNKLN